MTPANACPNRKAYIRALLAAPAAIRRQMAAERREFWLRQVEESRRRVELRQRRAEGLEGVLDPTARGLLQIDQAALRTARARLQAATQAWAAVGDQDGGNEHDN
jgi:hypothetical protein